MARSCAAALTMPEPRFVDCDQIAEVFLLTGGVRDVVKVCYQWIKSGPLGPMLIDYIAPTDVEIYLPDTVEDRLAELQRLIESTSSHEEEYKVNQEALGKMRSLYRTIKFFAAQGELFSGQSAYQALGILHIANTLI